MRIWLVDILVRLGVAVIADGRCRPRWYRSDQAKVVERLARYWWAPRHFRGVMRRKLTPADYYLTRALATGSNWQKQQYRKAASLVVVRRIRNLQLFEVNTLSRGAK